MDLITVCGGENAMSFLGRLWNNGFICFQIVNLKLNIVRANSYNYLRTSPDAESHQMNEMKWSGISIGNIPDQFEWGLKPPYDAKRELPAYKMAGEHFRPNTHMVEHNR